MNPYDHAQMDAYWQKKWEEEKLYETDIATNKEKLYVLDMFPYPSGEGLHVGHPKGYIATDIYSRMKKMMGFEILHPMGWDAFGLPAEQFALKNKIHPRIAVEKNIARFKEQLSIMGFNYDWSKEVNTTDPGFYKWTQWIFKEMWKKGLAYESYEPINWCPSCKTGLANEDLDGDVCERCGTKVEKKPLRQWILKITAYADRMIQDLDKLDWPEGVKLAQKNWIGKSDGSEIEFQLHFPEDGIHERSVKVFTTRADTLLGCTFIAISAELAEKWMKEGWKPAADVASFVSETLEEEKARNYDFKEVIQKEGIKTDIKATHPITKEKLPVFVANYVLAGYGTGALMAVPAHDDRDYEFAKKYDLPITQVILPVRIDKNNPHQEGYPVVSRKMVHGIIKNAKTDEYLMLDWKSNPWTTFVLGGVEEEEDGYEAILREIEEETGLSNLKFLYKSITAYSEYGAYHKGQNRVAYPTAYFFEFNDDSVQKELSDEEKAKHEPRWVNLKNGLPENFTCSEWDIWQKTMEASGFLVTTEDGRLFNSGEFDGMTSEEARKKIAEAAGGKQTSQYKLKDWVFARQRYWGEPFPMVFDENHTAYAVADSELPVKLPDVEAYEPTGTGESPLAAISEWVNVTGYLDENGDFVSCDAHDPRAKKFTRETNTMPQWAGSSWYYLRFADPHNENALIDKNIEKKWQPVDVYVGGDHATRHLIYARFWHKFLYDIGVVSYDEPFSRLEFLGFILAEDGRKMSKRLGNVINPDDVVKEYGADTLRVYEMFMAPFEQTVAWDTKSIVGVERFLERVWKLQTKVKEESEDTNEAVAVLHKTIKKVGEDIENFKFNTAVSAMMIYLNQAEREESLSKHWYGTFLKLLAPFAPHIAEAAWHSIGNIDSIHRESWPAYDVAKLVEREVTMSLQINGKLRGTFVVPFNSDDTTVTEKAKSTEAYRKYVGMGEAKKVFVIPNRLINIVI